jgi:hypothetical protein
MKIYMVDNGGEYSDYSVLGLFTDRDLAERYVEQVTNSRITEWDADVPPEQWTYAYGHLGARKEKGKWVVHCHSNSDEADPSPTSCEIQFGHYRGWDKPDPITGEYTHATGISRARDAETAKKILIDAFWKRVAELELA